MKTQNSEILKYLENGGALTPMDALKKFNCFRLASRINDLRNDGHEILTEKINYKGKKFARYSLIN